MAGRDRPVYCTQCGSIVNAGDNFCGVCGAGVSPGAPDAAPTREIPTQVYPPQGVPSRGGNRTLAVVFGFGVLLVLVLGIGAIVALNLLRGEPDTRAGSEPAPAANQEQGTTEQESAEEADTSQPAGSERLGVGDSVEAEGVRATLNGVRILPTTDFDRPIESPDNLFLATDLTFENVSDRPVAVSSLLEFVLKNEEGYSASQSIHSRQRQLSEGEISPGQKTSGEIVYEVPPDSRGLQLDYRPFLRGGTHTWYIGDAGTLPGADQAESTPSSSVREPAESAPASSLPAQVPAGSEVEIIEAAEDYYQAVDQENWAYTYDNLDSQTRSMFTEEEWYLKNQWFADNEGLELSTIDAVVNGSPSDPVVSVTVYRTFKDGTSITRSTYFVSEGGTWKHRFSQEEIDIFMPGVPFEEFVAAQ
ncbi:MAG: DUF4352 domain-containing protein [Actinobacteria bacterium]|nr:DUF4352 domain-containing protein [Actinomycetota bacterium]